MISLVVLPSAISTLTSLRQLLVENSKLTENVVVTIVMVTKQFLPDITGYYIFSDHLITCWHKKKIIVMVFYPTKVSCSNIKERKFFAESKKK